MAHLFPICVKKKFGFIDERGRVVIAPTHARAGDFSEGLAVVGQLDPAGRKDRITGGVQWLWGYIDAKGQPVTPMCFEAAREFSGGFAAVYQNRKCGYIDRHGKFLVKPQFDAGFEFSEGLAAVNEKSLNKFSYIDQSGQVVIADIACEMAGSFKNGLACISRPGGKFGYINRRGDYVWEPQG